MQLTRTMAVEVGRQGVRVNAVAPGFVPTGMTSPLLPPARRHHRRGSPRAGAGPDAQVRAARAGSATPRDIAYCVLYLASDATSFLTGQCLSPNGGVAMH